MNIRYQNLIPNVAIVFQFFNNFILLMTSTFGSFNACMITHMYEFIVVFLRLDIDVDQCATAAVSKVL